MSGKGFEKVFNLEGGIKAWEGLKAAGPMDTGMTLLKGDESPSEIIVIAYAMEEGLRSFYAAMEAEVKEKGVESLFLKLADIEEKHKQRLFNAYKLLDQSIPSIETFESGIVVEMMEGGFTTEEFLERNSDSLKTVPDVVNVAMMLETQALDLYLRYSQRVDNDDAKNILFDIAEEEKAHLRLLGDLI